MSAREQRVRAAVRAGRRLADPADVLGKRARERLIEISGLSPEGVELALCEHLEPMPGQHDLQRLLDCYQPAPRCHVVLSANVCTAPLRALACALAVAPQICVKPSRRDPVLAELLCEALAADADFAGSLELVSEASPRAGEQLHAYGSDATMAALRAGLPEGVRFSAHGSGFGVALIGNGEVEAAAQALAADMVPFDGQGCLSPRLALISDAALAEPFAEALHQALLSWGARVPRGPLAPEQAAALARHRQLIEALGRYWKAAHHAIALDPTPSQLALGPALRSILLAVADAPAARRLLTPWARHISCVGSHGAGELGAVLAELCPGARFSDLGLLQKPPLDGPVDRRQLLAADAVVGS